MRFAGVLAITLFWTATALADGGAPPPSNPWPTAPPGSDLPQAQGQALTPRQEAERIYALAFDEVTKARKDLESGKAKNAEKKFRRAQERCAHAVELDPKYYEAWNILGYASRKLGDYERAFAAYDSCLRLNPDYAPAREYLGEAWLERGELARAREQLAWLEKARLEDYVKMLRPLVEAYQAAHPDSAKVSQAAPGGQ